MNRIAVAILISMGVLALQAWADLDDWLEDQPGQVVEVKPDQPVSGGRNPFQAGKGPADRPDAVPGVIELSNGRQIPGYIYTTRYQPLLVYVEAQQRWRRLPLAAVLSIEAIVVEEKMELRWRWKATGEPERVYTGQKYPTRRLQWRFRLIDGTEITGAVKGKPIWVEYRGVKSPPFVLRERSKGQDGQGLDDLIYVNRILISKRAMNKVAEHIEDNQEKE